MGSLSMWGLSAPLDSRRCVLAQQDDQHGEQTLNVALLQVHLGP